MSTLHEIDARRVAFRMATVAFAAFVVAAAHWALTSTDIVASLQYAGAAACGVAVSDVVRDVTAHYRRR